MKLSELKNIIKERGESTSVGDEGGFAPMINDNEKALKLIVRAINNSGFKNGKDISICLDVAANELFKNKKYSIHSKKFISSDKTIDKYLKLRKQVYEKSLKSPLFDAESYSKNFYKSLEEIIK